MQAERGEAASISRHSTRVCILGAGPAGLSAAWELVRGGEKDVLVVEAQGRPGGLARTDPFRGQLYDVGPHRFFTSNPEVAGLWREVLGDEFRAVGRLTRIYYRERFFRYPISVADALPKLGAWQAAQALASFARARLGPGPAQAQNFEQWVSASFGRKLYESFFKVYTEKVWGMPCREISADWAAQRIKGLDLWEVARRALRLGVGTRLKTLVEEFDYPRLGAGQMFERMREQLEEAGVKFVFGHRVDRLLLGSHGGWTLLAPGLRVEAGQVLSSMPFTALIEALRPPPAQALLDHMGRLAWRDHITVDLEVGAAGLFSDQWIYVHDPAVRMARLANYANFSSEMASAGRTPLSAEYFCFYGDDLWDMPDAELLELAGRELNRMGLLRQSRISAGRVRRERYSYPSYGLGWQSHFEPLRRFVAGLPDLQLIGRGGMFKYNNMDHSVYSGLLGARNLLRRPGAPYDLWRINIDAEYQEAADRPA